MESQISSTIERKNLMDTSERFKIFPGSYRDYLKSEKLRGIKFDFLFLSLKNGKVLFLRFVSHLSFSRGTCTTIAETV